jgi:hypothetical protein
MDKYTEFGIPEPVRALITRKGFPCRLIYLLAADPAEDQGKKQDRHKGTEKTIHGNVSLVLIISVLIKTGILWHRSKISTSL